MKNLFKIIAAAGLAFTLASCGAANDVYGNNYPNNYPNGGVYRTPDGTVYRQGDVYRDRNGNVYQNGRVVRTGDVYGRPGIITRSGDNRGNYPRNNQNLPPGQAKKVYGGSAKDYAPGQVKKRNANWSNNRNVDWRYDDDKKNTKDYRKFSEKSDKNNKKFKKGKGKRND
ncbi:lipoprotein [Kaistella faecalis]|uniref:LptM family lipoprotein n=1 Tax=Kaistella faecalis TaxID=2852098 RepID=UPI001E392F12|nr:hypothetical protein [Chryseobacterium faecale]UFK98400.1 hypothetical protein LL667_03350 [Chryseobacterium faecale]